MLRPDNNGRKSRWETYVLALRLTGPAMKRRAQRRPNLMAFAFALWLAQKSRFTGSDIFESG